MTKKALLILCAILSVTVSMAAAEPIPITKSETMDKVIFDGKWTFVTEWKRSSLNSLTYDDGTTIQLRTAHLDDFIYVFVDAVTQTHFEKGADSAIICFDANNEKNMPPNENDYCFEAILDGKKSFVYQGGSGLGVNGNFKLISNPDSFIGISSVSDESDRYSTVPHVGYEFKIPVDLIGRSDNYGFYVGVYDAHSNKVYSWPQDITVDNSLQIPSSKKWGEIISPDKSLPEFELPLLALLSAFFLVIYLTKINRSLVN